MSDESRKNKESTRVLVTGAGGFIGQHLCELLRQKGYEVIQLLRRQQFVTASMSLADNNNHLGDINDRELLDRALEGVKIVFHLAGIAHVDGPDKVALNSVNVDGTASLIQAAQAANVQKIIFFSSSLAAAAEFHNESDEGFNKKFDKKFDREPDEDFNKESDKESGEEFDKKPGADTVTDYGKSKYQAELLLKKASDETDLDICILRPVNVYGPGMKGNLFAMVRLIAKGTLPPLPPIDARFSLIAVSDLCTAAIEAAESGSSNSKTYIVTDGVEYKINDIEEAIYTAIGRSKPRWYCPRVVLFLAAVTTELFAYLTGRKNSFGRRTYRNLMSGNTFSNSLICDELGFAPSTTFYNELPKIVLSIDDKQ